MFKLVVLTLVASFVAVPSFAAEWSDYRKIQAFGCHKTDGTCYMTLEGAPLTGAPGCSQTSVRWDVKNDPNGKTWLALVMLAHATNGRIAVYVDGCYVNQPIYPTFTYGAIEGQS